MGLSLRLIVVSMNCYFDEMSSVDKLSSSVNCRFDELSLWMICCLDESSHSMYCRARAKCNFGLPNHG